MQQQHEITLALAGVFQAAGLVQKIAREGNASQSRIETCVQSIFNTDPENVSDVYGGTCKVVNGLELIRDVFGAKKRTQDFEVTQYVISLLHLERQLAKKPAILDQIAAGVEKARGQVEHFTITHDVVMASLGELYSNTISTLSPRILVNGDEVHLSNPNSANKIRTLLLAGVRSAVLWKQCGGSRRQLLFRRKKVIGDAECILHESCHIP
ncbi:MAG: high frequency lysogenization protein HflD [Gammaproteobacteria bacterium]|nr:high frequency lysogenization protein HflD [Gammaproteobacteria bacterium]